MTAGLEGTVRLLATKAFEDHPNAIGVAFSTTGWDGPPKIAVNGGRAVDVHWSESALEIREFLSEASSEDPVVILTAKPEKELGQDVIYRLAGQRIRPLGVWEPVMAAFKVSQISPGLKRREALAQALLRHAPSSSYDPAPTGLLTEEHAWDALLIVLLGAVPTTLSGLVSSVSDPEVAGKLDQDVDLIPDLAATLDARLGPGAGAAISAVAAGFSTRLVPIGLAARVVFSEPGSAELTAAAVRLEQFFGEASMDAIAGRALADAAETAVREVGDQPTVEKWLADGEDILETTQASEYAWRSDYLPTGGQQRIEQFAASLEARPTLANASELARPLDLVKSHRTSRDGSAGLRTMEMAARLCLYLAEEESQPTDFQQAAELHVGEGGYVDLARESLDKHQAEGPLATAYAKLRDEVDERRKSASLRFAGLLASATEADSLPGCLGVEDVLREVVRPVANETAVLVVVLDGLSEAAWQSLRQDFGKEGWWAMSRDGGLRTPVVAALPSLTEVSRTSLLTGQRSAGNAATERSGFETALAPHTAALFHKADVAGRTAIESAVAVPQNRVVGVVVNAIDDQLEKGDQLEIDWEIDDIKPLRWLIDAASASARALVVMGDHGHVLERDSELRKVEGSGSRWRPANGEALDGEVRLKGPRVLKADGAILAAAIERLRYTKRVAGYHGGATPQEVLTPLVVLASAGSTVPEGWQELLEAEPPWWQLADGSGSPAPISPSVSEPPHSADKGPQISMDVGTDPEQEPTKGEAGWIQALLLSPVYAARRADLQRPPSDDYVRAILGELERGQGVASEVALSRAVKVPRLRVAGILSSVQQLLNIDGFQVLAMERSSGEARLDRELLRKQFSL